MFMPADMFVFDVCAVGFITLNAVPTCIKPPRDNNQIFRSGF